MAEAKLMCGDGCRGCSTCLGSVDGPNERPQPMNLQQNVDGSWSPAKPVEAGYPGRGQLSWWRWAWKNTIGRLIRHG